MAKGFQVQVGAIVNTRDVVSIRSECIRIPDPSLLIHLQFRRFAGCPVCNLHLHTIARRHNELLTASVREIVVFHSATEELLPHAGHLPFDIIADPEKRLYDDFGVESSARALLDPRAWQYVVRGVFRSAKAILRKHEHVPSVNPHGGRLGLPADFLIATDGRIVALKYGLHAYDQWSVEEILELSNREQGALALAQSDTRQTHS